jgi:galactokinase
MDQLVSVLGDERGALLIDCRAETARVVPLTNREVSILITNTNVRHTLASGEYGLRREQCASAARKLGLRSLRDASLSMLNGGSSDLDETERRRARHVITENERTVVAAEALAEGHMGTLGGLMYQSHASLRDDYAVSCAELDVLVESAHEIGERLGVFGARMTGGGFGGCTVTLVRTDCVNEVMAQLTEKYLEKTGRTLTGFVSRPARGAHPVNVDEWISSHKQV